MFTGVLSGCRGVLWGWGSEQVSSTSSGFGSKRATRTAVVSGCSPNVLKDSAICTRRHPISGQPGLGVCEWELNRMMCGEMKIV